ncbi:MAG: hypothetical protein HY935_04820 [Nitrosomonadales bacterium]|nr:hypothetical protein [Nitrosomonadales bacterium]
MDSGLTEQMSIGNAILDSDHKELLGMIREIDSASKARDHFALLRSVRQVGACMNRHFLNEELLANSLHIPFALHKITHQNMRDEIVLIRHQIVKEGVVTLHMEQYAQFLQDWLINHIADENTQLMKSVLQTRPYDFKLEGMGLMQR